MRDRALTRDDMRRDDDDRYRRGGARNGGPSFDRFNTDYLDQNSLSDFRSTEPKFELDHLATFAAGTRNGCIHAEDGLRKLRQMENTTGIWTMRCILIVERGHLVILDNSTGEELERFPIQLVQDPTAIFKNDRREIYNNLILFTIIDDPKKRSSQADMHIFQSCKAPAQEIVDEILAARNGQQRLPQGLGGSSLVIYQQNTNNRNYRSRYAGKDVYNFQDMKEYLDTRTYNTTEMKQFNQTSYSPSGQYGGPISQQRSLITRINTLREKEDFGGGSTEILERDVQLLNHCFDDIEKFVARLQQAAESYKELEKRKRDRGAKNKKRQSGDGMLNARARPPPDKDFVDIFQKFKLSFNLLAKLKAHIHDPNAPELVHFLFTPLSLIYEASRDPYHGNQNLGDQAVAPVLTSEAKQLLLNCLTSKEIELWQALGKHWTTSRDEWNGHIPPYVPEFYDGWQPAAGVIDEMTARTAVMAQQPIAIDHGRNSGLMDDRIRPYNPPPGPMHFPDEDRFHRNDFERFESAPRGYEPNPLAYETHSRGGFEPFTARGFEPVQIPRGYEPTGSRVFESQGIRGYEPQSRERSPAQSGMGSPYSLDFVETHTIERNHRAEVPKPEPIHSGPLTRQDENAAYYEELRRTDAMIYEAVHDRPGKNTKELSVQKGDILQVLDSSKNWWKLRNYKGLIGFAPYTILKQVPADHQPEGLASRTISETSFTDDNVSRAASRREPYTQVKRIQQVSETSKRYSIPEPKPLVAPPLPSSDSSWEQASKRASFFNFDERHSEILHRDQTRFARFPSSAQDTSYSPGPSARQSAAFQDPYGSAYPPPSLPPPRRSSLMSDLRRSSVFSSAKEASSQHSPVSMLPSDVVSANYQYKQDSVMYPSSKTSAPSAPSAPWPEEDYPLDVELRHKDKKTKAHLDELHARVTSRVSRSADTTRLDVNSTPDDVAGWMLTKGFSEVARERFQGYTGREIFQLRFNDFVQLIGHDEAIRLDGLIRLQKSTSGYSTRSAKELNDILEKRKQYINESDTDLDNQQEDYRGVTSSGQSLREQIVRKRGQLRQSSVDYTK
ncbi:epidermal growth factor receptor kinase substrate 8-like protein 1 isoform X3 [Biomphalaria glabrata]|uniref:Epidermal growth factor receptor kinase substrate 8-like protein 1 isoform X3 n=1 Tax=Biomphalaria glabrata TaxID=6526 RepID=A0A9W3BN12_BIOGL|nr:epidermal growth factor receptor kinase substrate 8-like protein 1 isoform X3 [Biomphalaria glabrata]